MAARPLGGIPPIGTAECAGGAPAGDGTHPGKNFARTGNPAAGKRVYPGMTVDQTGPVWTLRAATAGFPMAARRPLVVSAAALLALTGCGAEVPAGAGTTPAATVSAAASPPVAATSAVPTASSPRPADDGCPVTAAALQKVMTLPSGWRIKASSIECSHGWAQAGVLAPTPEQQGDGVVLFSYDDATGSWVDKGQGSSVDCAAFGIPERAGRDLSVCFYPN
jgi:hypothetical protein